MALDGRRYASNRTPFHVSRLGRTSALSTDRTVVKVAELACRPRRRLSGNDLIVEDADRGAGDASGEVVGVAVVEQCGGRLPSRRRRWPR